MWAVGFSGIQTEERRDSITHVKALGVGECFSIVQRLNARENVDIPLNQLCELDEVLSSLKARALQAPDAVERLVGRVEGNVHVDRETFGDRGERGAVGGVDDTVRVKKRNG